MTPSLSGAISGPWQALSVSTPSTRRAAIRLHATQPEYRLIKFKSVLPDVSQVEMTGACLLDFDRTAGFLTWQVK